MSLKRITDVSLCEIPCTFVVSVGDNQYTLLARDTRDAEQWVKVLNETRHCIHEGTSGCLLS